MRFFELIREEEDADLQDSVLVDTLVFIKNHGMTEIETLALISMVQRNGLDGFSYEALLDANERDPTIKKLIKSIDPKKVKMAADANSVVNEPEPSEADQQADAQNVVGNMAQRALNNREPM